MRFGADGAAFHPGVSLSLLADIHATVAESDRAGVRLTGVAELSALLTDGPIASVATHHIGPAARPVRAVLFDKSATVNWSLGWHQDRTIAVRARLETPGFGPWTVKQGILHVAPPFDIIAGMATLRIHLDDVDDDNSPLLIAPGSHRLGLIAEPKIADAVMQCGTATCLATRGDVWAYATPILHASAAAARPRRRRVLQVDYAAADLPGGLEWLGV
ncbi:phytanoyl-CoA dioxygenase [Sphingomonas sp. Leaf412]|nr:phytanoyl-CoA dioxygenase [Sphingomonas sp. Leaf412]